MQKHTLIFIAVLAILFTIGCKKPVKKFSSTRINPASQNFTYLEKALKDAKIVALGESSHGFGSMHAFKGNIIKHMHKNMGYDLLVFEAGYADVGLSWLNADKGDTIQLMDGMLPPVPQRQINVCMVYRGPHLWL